MNEKKSILADLFAGKPAILFLNDVRWKEKPA